jgi:hypothetical protein
MVVCPAFLSVENSFHRSTKETALVFSALAPEEKTQLKITENGKKEN